MIKIISGTYGLWDGGRLMPVTAKSGAFSAGSDEEARLVRDGLAEYAEYVQGDDRSSGHEDMDFKQLRELAKSRGLDVSKIRSKAALVDLLHTGQVEEPDQEIPDFDEEPLPVLAPEEPV